MVHGPSPFHLPRIEDTPEQRPGAPSPASPPLPTLALSAAARGPWRASARVRSAARVRRAHAGRERAGRSGRIPVGVRHRARVHSAADAGRAAAAPRAASVASPGLDWAQPPAPPAAPCVRSACHNSAIAAPRYRSSASNDLVPLPSQIGASPRPPPADMALANSSTSMRSARASRQAAIATRRASTARSAPRGAGSSISAASSSAASETFSPAAPDTSARACRASAHSETSGPCLRGCPVRVTWRRCGDSLRRAQRSRKRTRAAIARSGWASPDGWGMGPQPLSVRRRGPNWRRFSADQPERFRQGLRQQLS
jgi:hypothetical protein